MGKGPQLSGEDKGYLSPLPSPSARLMVKLLVSTLPFRFILHTNPNVTSLEQKFDTDIPFTKPNFLC